MACNPCDPKINEKDLVIDINIADIRSWDLNELLKVKSLKRWGGSITDDLNLYDYGLTAYDYALVDEMYSGTTIPMENNKFQMDRIGYIDLSGNTSYETYEVIPVSDEQIGNYFSLEGGWLQGFYKLEGFDYELLPTRFQKGVSIGTWVKLSGDTFSQIENNNDGFFLHLGVRAENKYAVGVTDEKTVYTSKHNYLTTEENYIPNPSREDFEKGIYENVIGFRFDEEGRIGYRRLNINGAIEEEYSDKTICINTEPFSSVTGTDGWAYISIDFKPYTTLEDAKNKCDSRLGDLTFYLNGRTFHTFKNFREFFFSGFDEDIEKQNVVPYTLSWGGGSFGLRHSYHWKERSVEFLGKTDDGQLYLSGNTTNTDNIQLNYESALLYEDKPSIEANVLNPHSNTFEIELLSGKTLLPYREYEISVAILDEGIFNFSGSTTNNALIGIIPVGFDFETLSETIYRHPFDATHSWFIVKRRFKTFLKEPVEMKVKIVGITQSELNSQGKLFLSDLRYVASDIEEQDPRKKNLRIGRLYGGKTHIGIQRLRVYNRSINAAEHLNNFVIDGKRFGFRNVRGGRVIYV